MKTCLLSLLVLITQLASAFDARLLRMSSTDTNWNSMPMSLVQNLRPLAASREFKGRELIRTEPAKILFPLITNGMPKEAVEGWLGKPDGKSGPAESERWEYTLFYSQMLSVQFRGDTVASASGGGFAWSFALVPVLGSLPLDAYGTVSNAFISDLARVPLASQPLISEGDIVEYDPTNHLLTLQSGAFKRLQDSVKANEFVPVVAVVEGRPVSLGGFWGIHLGSIPPVPNIISWSDDILNPPSSYPTNTLKLLQDRNSGRDAFSDEKIQNVLSRFRKLKR